ncbi:MAG: hypothetical protein KatS3mg076_0376 [Candidatus Binatia bacterium]|nr:MAG: hypothetical protein KatS3mg076_0376 [Candidatus Binatia bacterium]
MRYLRVQEVMETLGVDEAFLRLLETEGLIHPKTTLEGESVLSESEAERVRLAAFLMTELEVNLAGTEVILHLREQIFELHHQFDELLRALARELRERR